jgi:hypothetical protein
MEKSLANGCLSGEPPELRLKEEGRRKSDD